MSRKLALQIRVDIEQLCTLMHRHRGLIEECKVRTPTEVEIDALASQLHSFYSDIENVFKRICIELDEEAPTGEFWHARLLDVMVHPAPKRPAVVTEDLKTLLRPYLEFRHVFRHAYTFELKWDKMAPLVLGVLEVFDTFEREIQIFLTFLDSRNLPSQS